MTDEVRQEDALAKAIGEGLFAPLSLESGAMPTKSQIRSAANAVRTYLESPEVVERAWDNIEAFIRERRPEFLDTRGWREIAEDKPDEAELVKGMIGAALNAAGGKQDAD